jgi:ABC-2 type transport system ATP-binding protein
LSAAIEATGLTKVYGHAHALDGVDLRVEEGSIFGFLGPNGAGKTTTVRLLTGLALPTSGSIRVLGADAGAATVRSQLGFLPDVPGFYEWMTGRDFLEFTGRMFGLSASDRAKRVDMLLELAGLTDVKTKIGGYSRGMKQRLGVAQALINSPRLLVLDEPTSALDPLGRKAILEMLASLRGRTTVFFSTHILADIERVCDTIAILDRGRLIEQATLGELKARYGLHKIVVEVTERADVLARDIESQPWATSVERRENGTLRVSVGDVGEARRAIPRLVADGGLGLVRFEAAEVELEEVFVALVGGKKP